MSQAREDVDMVKKVTLVIFFSSIQVSIVSW